MGRTDFDHAKEIITQAVLTHMPSAAVASGLVSAVDIAPLVAAVLLEHPHAAVSAYTRSLGYASTSDLSVPAVREYCSAFDLPCGDGFVDAFRAELLKSRMRAACGA